MGWGEVISTTARFLKSATKRGQEKLTILCNGHNYRDPYYLRDIYIQS